MIGRVRMRRFTASVALAAVLLAACGGGGGGGDAKPEQYASDVCGALKQWLTSIQQRNADLAGGIAPGIAPKEGKKALRSYLKGVVSDTEQVIARVGDAGIPDVDNGERGAKLVLDALRASRAAFENAGKLVEQLPTGSARAFNRAAQSLAATIQSSVQGVGASLQQFHSVELAQAFSAQSACATV